MADFEPKQPYPNESIPPPPVVNPPSSRSEKNLKTKKTTRTMNPKPASTMKHHDMLSKSTDVNFKKVITRSSSKGSDTGMGVEEMEYEEESNDVRAEKVVVADTGDVGKSMNGVISDEIRAEEVLVTNVSENVVVKEVNGKKVVSGDVANGNVSDMFPELSSVNFDKKSSDKIDITPDIPVHVEINPLLNLKLNSGDSSRENCNGGNVSKDGVIGKEERASRNNNEVQGTKENKVGVGESSGNKDVEMQDSNKASKPMLFSNVVKGASFIGGNKLKLVPCAINEGRIVVDMDPVIEEGSMKWGLTVVGYFVGMKLSYRDIVGHLKRMWRPYCLDEIIVNESVLYFFKFNSEEGLKTVVDNGPWLVNQKPLFVQKWVAGNCLVKPEPTRLPLWVRIYNVPLEAWNVEGISRISSRIGTPLFMDKITTDMCEKGCGRASYARVLVEVDAVNGIVDSVEVWYNKLNRSMKLRVEYAWQPPLCSHCCVFGHSIEKCVVRVVSDDEITAKSGGKLQTNVNENDMQQREEGCSLRMLNEKEKMISKEQNMQAKVNTNDVQKNVDGWKSVDYWKTNRNYGEHKSDVGPDIHLKQAYNSYGVGNNRGGMYMGRGGPSFRGRGGFNGRGGMSSYQMNNDKRSNQMNENMKGKEIEGTNVQNHDKNKGVTSDMGNQVKYSAQRNFVSKNRIDLLADDGGEEKENEWQEVKINIDVACEMGIPFDENEIIKWPHELQKYYIEKCDAMKNSDKRDLLINKIRFFDGDIDCSRANIEQFAHKKANEEVVFEMENSGTNREQAYGVVYGNAYRREMKRIQDVVLKKQLAEVELFILSGKPFSDAVKEGWTDVMIDFYNDWMSQNRKDTNTVNNVEDVMGNGNYSHADFRTHKTVSSAVDMVGIENVAVACGNVTGCEVFTADDGLN